MQPSSQLSLELQNSLRLVHRALTERGRKGVEETPLENFYSAVNRCFMRSSPPKTLLKRDVEAFYSEHIGSEDFISLIENGLFPNGPGMHVYDIIDLCLQEYLAVDNRRQTVDRYVDFLSVRQLWITFAKLDTFGKLGLPNAEINELLIRVASLSNMEGISSNLSSVSSMELVGFLDLLNLLIDQVFLYTNKQIVLKMVQNLYDGIVHALLMKGTLKKRGHIVKNWKDRFFVLTVDTLTYYETSEMSVQKGQITINTSANVCAISEQGKPTKSSSRFRVTCGSTGTTTDCVANDVRLAMDWVHSIDLAILYHRVEGRNFLHRLRQARQFTQKLPAESPEDSGGDKQLGYTSPPASLSGSRPPPGPEIQRRPHAYEEVDMIDEFVDQHQQQKFGSKSTSHITTTGGEEYATVDTNKARKKSSADGITAPPPPHSRPVEETPPVPPPHNQPQDTVPPSVASRRKQSEELPTPPTFPERSKPPPPPLPAKEPNQGVTYIDIDFVNIAANNSTRQPSETPRRARQDHAVEYTSVDAVAMAVANVNEQKSKQLDVSPPHPTQRSPSPSRRPKPMKDVPKQPPKNAGKDGDYINVGLVNTPTPASPTHTSSQRPETRPQTDYINVNAPVIEKAAKPMKEVPNRPLKKEPSKDGDYVGLGYSEGKPIVKTMQEVTGRPPQKASKDGDYIGINYDDGHPSVKPQRMADVTRSTSPRKQQSLDGSYVGLDYDGGHQSVKKMQSTPLSSEKDGYINVQFLPPTTEKPRAPPPVKPYSGSKQQSSLATPPQAAPRNVGSRPKSSYELDHSQGLMLSSSERKSKTDDYLDLVPAGKSSKDSSKHTKGGLTLAASSKESNRDYLLVVPDPSSNGKKLPPEKPAPYGATHTYVNQPSIPTETQGAPPPLPPKLRNP